MSDEFDRLEQGLKSLGTTPTPRRRASDLDAAMQAFEQHQEGLVREKQDRENLGREKQGQEKQGREKQGQEKSNQDSADDMRITPERPWWANVTTGVMAMVFKIPLSKIRFFKTRLFKTRFFKSLFFRIQSLSRPIPALTSLASVAVLGLGVYLLIPHWQDDQDPVPDVSPGAVQQSAQKTADGAEETLSESESRAGLANQAQERVVTESTARSQLETSPADLGMAMDAPDVAMSRGSAGSAALDSRVRRQVGSAEMSTVRISNGHAPTLMAPASEASSEAFPEFESNGLKVTAESPVSTFSVDVDTAGYGIVRSSLMNGQMPPPGAVRIEEMINYFPYDYSAPHQSAPHQSAPNQSAPNQSAPEHSAPSQPAPGADDDAFRTTVTTMEAPWDSGRQLVTIGIQGRQPAIEDRPPLNLVLLVDTSGSMQGQNRLPLLKQSMRLMLGELRADDEVAIVTYAGSAGVTLEPTPAQDRAAILTALDQLQAGGGTAGAAGLQQAYQLANRMAEDGEVSRVLLATDGDFNIGISDPEALETYIGKQRDSGTYLSVLGFGRGNLDDATMQALAQHGNGQAAYIDTLSEAQKVLVDQLTGALVPIADDVKIQVEFNPARVQEYRLIGYETRSLAREDFSNDKVDAGDIGAGHQVTAIYEITPVGSESALTEPLRYADQHIDQPGGAVSGGGNEDELGFLRLRYKAPGETTSQLIETPIPIDSEAPSEDARFAVAIAGFGQLLSGSVYLGEWSWKDAIALAEQSRGEDRFGYRAEAIRLMRLAGSLDDASSHGEESGELSR
ncbi:VWA domain-containing protein [Halomonas cupida]|uniref:YfbK domain-containing protein n=1 Tax=Halomonas cupida TaxID=44933 RepID=UPI0039B411A2